MWAWSPPLHSLLESFVVACHTIGVTLFREGLAWPRGGGREMGAREGLTPYCSDCLPGFGCLINSREGSWRCPKWALSLSQGWGDHGGVCSARGSPRLGASDALAEPLSEGGLNEDLASLAHSLDFRDFLRSGPSVAHRPIPCLL